MKQTNKKLFYALFRKTGAFGCTLAGFELGVGLADYVFGTLAADDLAISMTAFGGGK